MLELAKSINEFHETYSANTKVRGRVAIMFGHSVFYTLIYVLVHTFLVWAGLDAETAGRVAFVPLFLLGTMGVLSSAFVGFAIILAGRIVASRIEATAVAIQAMADAGLTPRS